MAPEKVTTMVLTVDLKCARCYKKVKKVLCNFPQIRDQIYNEKNNTVTIKVVCCSPEKIREKLCIKGRKSIQRIEIIEPEPPKPPPPAPAPDSEPQKPPKSDPPPPPSEKPKDKPPPPDPAPEKPPEKEKPESESKPKPPPPDSPKQPAPPPSQPHPPPMPFYPPPPGMHVCCQDCYEGRPGGPCYGNYYTNRPGPCEPPFRPPVSGGYYYGGWPSSQNNYHPGYCYPPSRGYCFSEENPQACIIM